jgi:carboxymethylenebutenolidase
VSFNDPRIRAQYVGYPSPGGNSGAMRGYLVQPAGAGPFPAVLWCPKASCTAPAHRKGR